VDCLKAKALTLTLSQRERGHCLGVLTNSEYALEEFFADGSFSPAKNRV